MKPQVVVLLKNKNKLRIQIDQVWVDSWIWIIGTDSGSKFVTFHKFLYFTISSWRNYSTQSIESLQN